MSPEFGYQFLGVPGIFPCRDAQDVRTQLHRYGGGLAWVRDQGEWRRVAEADLLAGELPPPAFNDIQGGAA